MKPSESDLWRRLQGWCSPREGDYLYNIASNIIAGDLIVEIGTYAAKSAIALGLGCMESGANVITIDNFQGNTEHIAKPTLEVAQANIAKFGLSGFIEVKVSDSQQACQMLPKIRIGYIDGNHDYNSVLSDFFSIWKKLVPGGDLLFHDYHSSWNQVVECVNDIENRWPLKRVAVVDAIIHFRGITK